MNPNYETEIKYVNGKVEVAAYYTVRCGDCHLRFLDCEVKGLAAACVILVVLWDDNSQCIFACVGGRYIRCGILSAAILLILPKRGHMTSL